MVKKTIIILIIFSANLFGQDTHHPDRYVSVGFLDHKTGTSLVGFAKTIWQNDKHDIFIGGGTLIAAFTASIGWKYYFNDSSFRPYSVLAIHGVSNMGGSFSAPFVSLGVEKNIWKRLFINGGLNSTIRPHPDKGLDFVNFPTIHLNYRY